VSEVKIPVDVNIEVGTVKRVSSRVVSQNTELTGEDMQIEASESEVEGSGSETKT